jgi:SAM-dependent methyltransferase
VSSSLHASVTRAYWKTTAARSHASSRQFFEHAANHCKSRLAPWLPSSRDAVCLDLACGCGEVVYLLEREGFRRATGVDLCQEELDQARPFVRGELVCDDVLQYLERAPSRSVDFITALNFLEHLPKDVLGGVLKEARRVLRPGGTFVAMVPNAISPFGNLTRHWDITHEWAFTPNNFRQLAALTGFSPQIEFRECGPVPHGIKSGVRYALWQMLRAGIAAWFLIEVADRKGGVYTMDMMVRMRTEESECREFPK